MGLAPCEGFPHMPIHVLFTWPRLLGPGALLWDEILVTRSGQDPEWLPSEEKRVLVVSVR